MKSAIVKSKKFDLSNFHILCSGKSAYGFIRFEEPKEITDKEFVKLRNKHQISDEEANKWWNLNLPEIDEKKKLYFYSIRDFISFEEPKPFKLPQGAQVIVDKVELTEALDPKKIESKKLEKLTNEELVKLHAELHRLFEKEI